MLMKDLIGDHLRERRDVLNPSLHARLVDRIGPVHVSNEGQEARFGSTFTDPTTRKQHTGLVTKGEFYRLNCPYCGDQRQRLYVNYQFMCPDPTTGEPMRGLAH